MGKSGGIWELPDEQLLPGMQQAEVSFREAVYSKGDKCNGDSELDQRSASHSLRA